MNAMGGIQQSKTVEKLTLSMTPLDQDYFSIITWPKLMSLDVHKSYHVQNLKGTKSSRKQILYKTADSLIQNITWKLICCQDILHVYLAYCSQSINKFLWLIFILFYNYCIIMLHHHYIKKFAHEIYVFRMH